MWHLYIARFGNGNLYTGISKNVRKRISAHNAGSGAKSLRGKGPVLLLYWETVGSYSDALKREAEIKGWSRQQKLEFLRSHRGGPSPKPVSVL